MAVSNYERVRRALELLRNGLAPFVAREIRLARKEGRVDDRVLLRFVDDPLVAEKPVEQWDVALLLKLMWNTWNDVFKHTLGQAERSFVSEMRDWRNRWAHQEPFSSDDTYRVLDSARRLLAAIAAPEAEELDRMTAELLRIQFDEKVRQQRRKAGGSLIEAAASGMLKPWREVVSPHEDVAGGRYQQAEFAADLWQVYLGEARDEYQDPAEFFRRTYPTQSLKGLLVNAVRRLSGQGGDPVVQLQTNFGGGKTHSMLALYHLFSGLGPGSLPGVEDVLREAGFTSIPRARRVVLVGNRISVGNPSVKDDGTVVRTLWGELAWQLGRRDAYERVRADDERATNPGDTLRQLLADYGPCLILIDEWVAYARQLHDAGDLPAGSFETQFTFAQALTEAVKAVPHALLVVSLPASESPTATRTGAEDVEVGGSRGREALERLRNVIGRVEVPWRPATPEESFEIVRRRLFQPMTDPEQFEARDVVARAFMELYEKHPGEFPAECRQPQYERRIKAAYPIHPEVFDRLYGDWATLVRFQRTRGVLRLMAAVIHSLWEQGDRSPLILPSTLPMNDSRVQSELTRYLTDNWVPVIQRDVDGEGSLPRQIDGESNTFGRYGAARRVARTIFLGSAPTYTAANRGLDDRRIRLGCVGPGESPNVFGDALRRLASRATYLYTDGTRYWYAPQPNVNSLAEERAEQLKGQPDRVAEEIERRVRDQARHAAGPFAGVHPFPRSSQEVPDEPAARLVILGLDAPHQRSGESPARAAAAQILEWRGHQPRVYRNTLVFLAVDRSQLDGLDEAVRRYQAWDSILREREALNLDPHQTRTAERQRADADATVNLRLEEAFQWVLVPEQPDPQGEMEWVAVRLSGSGNLVERAGKKLVPDGHLYTQLGGNVLRLQLDKVPLWRGDHVEVRQLVEDFFRYLYLPRLRDPSVLVGAIENGVGMLTWLQDGFAYAESYDEAAGRYRGLRAGEGVSLDALAPVGLLVRPAVAERQLKAELVGPAGAGDVAGGGPAGQPATAGAAGVTVAGVVVAPGGGQGPGAVPGTPPQPVFRRFYGRATLNPMRVGGDAGKIAEEVIAHLAAPPGAEVRITLEIEASLPAGFSEPVIRTVRENCNTLKFEEHHFEEE
ncbi:Swt1 family HEPN domain-containing protein [Thermaerobacter subterraneus]|uniref:ATPase (AAA+ superfamily) n=1 Tax=Thermaerobacter subterraneus DSM 13965 TaxID=867903 RepID=K6Q2K6_9FIRM|nr:Swt1 family HEPN domain-containing protein [Thermaerobacter subterraneus]EKP95443.1 putative ATPase (AAA+ superfamily) [Thermaerobacter subterraneus DSM 13965]